MPRALPPTLLFAAVLTVAPGAQGAGLEVTSGAAAAGAYGLEVLLGPDCEAPQDLTLDGDDDPLEGTYEACRTILAHGVTVAGAGATLRAGQRIALGSGFGSDNGLVAVLDGALSGGPTFVEDSSPIVETVYAARFSARSDGLVLGGGERLGNLVGYSGGGEVQFRLLLQPAAGGGHELSLEARLDGGGLLQTPPGQEVPLDPGWNQVELLWAAADGEGELGHLLVSVNGGELGGLQDLDNAASTIETVHWGAVDGAVFTASGTLELDTFSSTR